MPAPLGKVPTKKMPDIRVLGADDSAATRAALRFFRERRIVVRYTDVRKSPIPRAELQRFAERLGAALVDTESRAWREGGLADAEGAALVGSALVDRLLADPRLVRLPLVRHGEQVTAGHDEAAWKAWLARRR